MANDEGPSPKMDAPITPNPNPSPHPSPRALPPPHNPPSTPIAIPKHHHSVQSSPGRLSLHDYRKLQSSPEAASTPVAAGRTLKRKGKASNLTATPVIPNPRPYHPQRRTLPQTSPSPAPRRKSENISRDESDLTVVKLSEHPLFQVVGPATVVKAKKFIPTNVLLGPRNRSFEHNRNSDSRRFGRVDLDVDFSTPSGSWIPHFPSPPLTPLTPTPRARSQLAPFQKQLSRSNTYPYHHKSSTSDPLHYPGKERVTLRHRGVSFEIINPHDSLELFKITTAEEQPRPLSDQATRRRHSSASLVTMARNFSSNNPYLATIAGNGSRSISHPSSSQDPPDVPLKDFPRAYDSIFDGSRSAKFPVGPLSTVNRNNPTAFAGKTFDIPSVPPHLIRPGPVTAQPWYDDNMTGVPYGADYTETPPIMSGAGFLRSSKSQDTIQDAQEFDDNVKRLVTQNKDQRKIGRKRGLTVKRDEDPSDPNDPKGKSKSTGIPAGPSDTTRPRKFSNMFSSKASRTSNRPLADVTNTHDMPKQKSPSRQKSRQERRRLTKRHRTRDHSTVSNIIAGYGDDSDLANPRPWSQERQEEERENHQNMVQNHTFSSHAIAVGSRESSYARDSTDPITLSEYLAETRESSRMGQSSDGFEHTQLFHPSHVAAAEDTRSTVEEPSDSVVRAKVSRPAHHNKKRREPEFSLNPFENIPAKDPETIGPAGDPPNMPLPPLPSTSYVDEEELMDFSSSPQQTSYGNTGTLLDPTQSDTMNKSLNQSLGSMVKGLRPVSGVTESDDEEDFMDPNEEKDRWEREMNANLGRSPSGQQVTTLGGYRPNKIRVGTEVVGGMNRPGILRRSALEERLEKRRSRQSQRVRVPKNVTFTSQRASVDAQETSSSWSTDRDSQLPTADTQMSLQTFESQGSIANYSSCDSLRQAAATAWSPLEVASLVPQHPARSSFVYTNRMVNDAQSGRPVLVPEYLPSVGAFPDQNSVTEPVRVGELVHTRGRYHPTALGSRAAAERRAARWEEAGLAVPEPALQRQLVSSKSKVLTQPMPSPFGGYDQRVENVGRHVESLNRPSGVDKSDMITSSSQMAEQGTEGSFSKMTTVGEKFNLTGSPNGTGMRAVGSSMADYTSSGNGIDLSSSPYAHHQQALMTRDLRRLRGFPSPHEEIPLSPLGNRGRSRRFPEDDYQKATPGLIYQDVLSQRLNLAAEGKAPTLQTSTVDTRLVPVYGAPPPIVHNSESKFSLPLSDSCTPHYLIISILNIFS
jgi:hypothetical protein